MSVTESYETATAETVDPICVCCDYEMPADEDYCPECQTPAEITRSVTSRGGVMPHFISVVGPSNAGKTVYLGLLLDMLCGGAKNLKGFHHRILSHIYIEQLFEKRLEYPQVTLLIVDV